MNKLKLSWFLFILAIVLAVVFGFGLLVPDMKGNTLYQVVMWCGLISQLLQAGTMFISIRNIKKGKD